MLKNYIKTAFGNLVRNKLFSFINIAGLAIGLAACIFIMLFVRDELSYDDQWTNANSVHRLTADFFLPGREPILSTRAQGPAKEALKNYFPEEIEAVTRFNQMDTVIRYDDKLFYESMMWTDPETADIFNFNVIAGDLKAALNDNASLAISESFARKHFGEESPIGKILNVSLYSINRDYQIAAVFEDLPHNTVLSFQALAMIDEKDFVDFSGEFEGWYSTNNYTYFQLKDGASISTINDRLEGFTNQNIQVHASFGEKASDIITHSTQPLTDIQLNPRAPVGREMKPTGSMTNVLIFSAIAALILLIACINFMNLSTAKSTKRAREVALRKVMGAHRRQLIFQFLVESVWVALIGLILGLVLVEAFLPLFNETLGKELIFDVSDGATMGSLFALIAFVGVIGGVYPALILSGFLPAKVLKANKSTEPAGSSGLRNILVVLQFSISIGLIVATGVVYGQKYYATAMDPGFNKNDLLVVYGLGRSAAKNQQDAFLKEVLRLPNVINATYSNNTPSDGNENNTLVSVPGDDSQSRILLGTQNVDYRFFETYQIPFLEGRGYSKDHATDGVPSSEGAQSGDILKGSVVLNEGALRRLDLGSPNEAIGRTVEIGISRTARASLTVIGVVPDIHFQSLRSVMRPVMYLMMPSNYRSLTVRFSDNGSEMAAKIEAIWKSMVTSIPFQYEYVDEMMTAEFEEEKAQSLLLGIFAGLAILIACLGLYGLASFTAERRTKEIGIRKVMGARVRDIVTLLVWQFTKPVLLANLIAWPIATWGMLMWLETFPYRPSAWILAPLCLGAGLIALTIAWGTVGGNAAKVARTNPIKALRCE